MKFIPMPKFTTDRIVRRLRWIMMAVILFDMINTLLGQPGSYWHHPFNVDEGNHLSRFFMTRGYLVFCIYDLAYLTVAFLMASMLPRRVALIVIFAFILGHYFGASTWLNNRWNFGTHGVVIYGIILAMILVRAAFPEESEPSAEGNL